MSTIRFRRMPAIVAAVTAATIAVAGCSQKTGASADSGYTLRVGFISTTPTPAGPEGWAQKNGTLLRGLKAAGVRAVKWVPFKNGPDLSAAVSGGSLDLSILGDTPALTAKANGIPTRLVNQSFVGSDTWLFAKKGGPRSIADLKGKTIATQVGSYMYRYLVALLKQQGIYDTVKITHVYTANAVASLQSGGIAAYAAPAGVLTAGLTKAGFPLLDKASADHPDLLGTSVTVITEKALKAHPTLPAAWNATRAAAVADVTAHPDAYYAFAANATGTTSAVVTTAQPISGYPAQPFTDSGLALLTGTDAFLAANKLAKADVDIAAWRTG
jgi:sulfonate transport system substrate-binding protein